MKVYTKVGIPVLIMLFLSVSVCWGQINEELLKAVINGEVSQVRLLLEKGADANAKDNTGKTALMLASNQENAEIVKLLINNNADVNAKDRNARTALMCAFEKGFKEVAELLLDNGADINAKDRIGDTTLMFASIGGNTDVVKMLLDKGFDVNAKNENGMTPLIYASMRGNIEIAKFLIENGADINAKDRNGMTALLFAFEKGFNEMAELLLDNGADINAKGRYGDTALMVASKGRNIDIVKMLLDKGFDVNAKNENGITPLIYASNGRNTDIMKALLDNGADIDAKDRNGRTALINAAMGGNIDIAKILLDNGADVNTKDKNSMSALMFAFERGFNEMAELLLENGADINAKGRYGDTALMIASKGRNTDIVKMLLDKGFDVNAKNENGITPLIYASNGRNTDIMRALLDNGADIDAKDRNGRTALINASIRRNIDVVKFLLDNGANANAKENSGKTALMFAFEIGLEDLAELLLEKGADINVIGRYGDTALMFASNGRNIDLVKMLVDQGFDVNAKNANGMTPLLNASMRENIDIAKFLIENGADINAKDRNGMTALLNASMRGNIEVAKMLLEKDADIEVKERNGRTALLIAFERGQREMAELLLENGADISEKGRNGETALMFASLGRNSDIVKMLLDKGLDVNAQDRNGRTALLHAAMGGNIEVAKMLLDNGAIINIQDSNGNTALMAALTRDETDLVKLLLEHGTDVYIKDRTGRTALTVVLEQGSGDMAKIFIEKAAGLSAEDKMTLTALFKDVLAEQDSVVMYSTRIGMVTENKINVYKDPDLQSDHIGSAQFGDVIFILTQRQEPQVWCQVYFHPGKIGWIYGGDSIEDFQNMRFYSNRNMNCDWVHGQAKNNNLQLYDMLPGGKATETKSKEYHFTVERLKVVRNVNEVNTYYNVLPDEFLQGPARLQLNQWVNTEDVIIFFDRVLWVYCQEAAFSLSPDREPDPEKLEQAIQCLNLLIEKYPDQRLVNVLDEYNRYLSLAKIEALLLLSDMQLISGNSEDAVNSLQQIINRFPDIRIGGNVSGVRAKQKLAEMYWKHLDKPEEAVKLYLDIIKQYPKEPLHLFEHITMLDIVAMKDFATMISEGNVNSELSLEDLQEIVDSAENEIVIMMGVIERAKILRKQQHYEQAIQELREIIEQYPSVSHNYYFFDHDFSVSAFEIIVEILFKDLNRQEDAIAFCEDLYNQYESEQGTRLGIAALFFKAEILDQGTGSRETVIQEYESLLNKISAVGSWSEFYSNQRLIGQDTIFQRLQEIRSFMQRNGSITSEKVSLYVRPDPDASILRVIDRNMTFSIQYRDANQSPFWHKVLTADEVAGWLREENIRFINKSIMLESELYSAWSMWGANKERTRSIEGEPIIDPEVRTTIQDVAANEILFWDANHDNLPDVIISGVARKRPEMPLQEIRMRSDLWTYEIVCIDGKTQDVLWKVESAEPFTNSTPRIEDGILYSGANTINASTGEVIWNFGNESVLRLTDRPIELDENRLYSITSTAAVVFDKRTGEDKGVIRFTDHPVQSKSVLKDSKLYYHSMVIDRTIRPQLNRSLSPEYIVVCYDLDAFKEQWTYPSVYSRETPPIIVGDMLLCSSIESKIYAFDTNTGKLQWEYEIDQRTVSPFAVRNGVMYFITRNKSIFGVNISDGKPMTQFHIDSDVGFMDQVSLCIVADVIYAGSRDGNLYALRLQDGELLWKFNVGAPIFNSISSVGKVVAVMTQDNTLHLIGEKH